MGWLDDLPTCETCGEKVSGSHYHCGRCIDPKPTSMYGHYVTFDDGTRGHLCDEANLGKTFGRHLVVSEEHIRPSAWGPE